MVANLRHVVFSLFRLKIQQCGNVKTRQIRSESTTVKFVVLSHFFLSYFRFFASKKKTRIDFLSCFRMFALLYFEAKKRKWRKLATIVIIQHKLIYDI